ncbi:hypothetical protein ACH9DO_04140 [Kocuria sp. M1N1S27]|uniref:hypothetical protein n=1 Tax=Kocuria kalidii TaxID=3376283 RepID=UPI0037AA5AC1
MTAIAPEPTGNNDLRAQPVTGAAPSTPVVTPPLSPATPAATATPRAPGSRLGPGEDFPDDLTGLVMADLQVLHSRIARQLDHDHLTDPAGPHPCTMDRQQDLLAELDTRDTA